MYLLYCDESGNTSDASQRYFVLAGICMFERKSYWLSCELDKIVQRFDPSMTQNVELHGSPMLKGKGFWRNFPEQDRITAFEDALCIINPYPFDYKLFICVIDKAKASPRNAIELAFEQLSSRFDHYLMRLHKSENTQRGIIIFDKTTYESTIQNLATDFRTIGHTWGVLRNLAEVPLFIDSKASRIIQMADLIAYSAFQNYERGNPRYFSIIKNLIDTEGGIQHGLYELI